ncbi:DUF2957 domain-containing protein [Paraburkholderia megapolitana]|nr:DUF2957 domain-containing protein [Paraburkholderia megapolitana]
MAVAGLLLVACNGDNPGNPGPVNVAQCSGAACGPSGGPTSPPSNVQLCPTSLDYSTTYTGGSGSGEYIKVKFNSTANPKTYQMTFVESEVPTSAGQVNNTRAGLTINGTYTTPNLYTPPGGTGTPFALPSAEQNRCAIVLQNGATADGTYKVTINPQDPPILFVGMGIMGGSIPGATIQFAGATPFPGLTLGVVPSRTFDSYPFIGFSQTVTDFSQVAGTYNELGFRITPEGTPYQTAPSATPGGAPTQGQLGWQPDAIQASETFKADGTCVADTSKYSCSSTGSPWTLRTNADGSADNVFRSGPVTGSQVYPAIGVGVSPIALFAPDTAHGVMIVGNVGGTLVPVIIRVGQGYVNPTSPLLGSVLDDQIGISLLAPATTLTQSDLSGGYVGANSVSACGLVTYGGQSSTAAGVGGQTIYASAGACLDASASTNASVNSTAALFQPPTGGLLNPFAATTSSNFTMDFTQTQPGLVKVTATTPLMSGNTAIYKAGDTGAIIKVGQVYALLMNGVNQQFTTQSPSNVSAVNPFLTVGAFVQ